jgi:hypothetical protein
VKVLATALKEILGQGFLGTLAHFCRFDLLSRLGGLGVHFSFLEPRTARQLSPKQ